VTGQQWQLCDRCGLAYPMGELVKQKGMMVCTRTCFDNLEVERRQQMIERTLVAASDQEGVDNRTYDRGFFDGFDEEVT
jgi:hypothetical protein